MTHTIGTDENIRDAVHRLDASMGRLFGVRTRMSDTGTLTAPSLYQQLCQERYERPQSTGNRTAPHGAPAARLDLMELSDAIRDTLTAWTPAGTTTAEAVAMLTAVSSWRPEDAPEVLALAAQFTAWADRARDLLEGGSRLEVRAACPACDRRYYYEPDGIGGQKRIPALTVTVTLARCAVCGETWQPEQFGFLIRLLEADT